MANTTKKLASINLFDGGKVAKEDTTDGIARIGLGVLPGFGTPKTRDELLAAVGAVYDAIEAWEAGKGLVVDGGNGEPITVPVRGKGRAAKLATATLQVHPDTIGKPYPLPSATTGFTNVAAYIADGAAYGMKLAIQGVLKKENVAILKAEGKLAPKAAAKVSGAPSPSAPIKADDL